MSDPLISDTARPLPLAGSDEKTLPVVVYVLFLLGFLTGFLSTVVGLIMAYVLRADAGSMARSHYTFLIRTFWISLIASVVAGFVMTVGIVLSFILIGIPFVLLAGLAFTAITLWFVVRCVVGLVRAVQDEAYPAPRSWIV